MILTEEIDQKSLCKLGEFCLCVGTTTGFMNNFNRELLMFF
jgi:hypothetical protein